MDEQKRPDVSAGSEAEAERLRAALKQQQQVTEQLAAALAHNRKMLADSAAAVTYFQNTGLYRGILALRRLKLQLFSRKAEERRDCLRWIGGILSRKLRGKAAPLSRFDMLHYAGNTLRALTDPAGALPEGSLLCSPEGRLAKQGKQVFLFAGVPYYDIGGGQRSAQLAKTFNAMGLRVHYLHYSAPTEQSPAFLRLPCVTHRLLEEYSVEQFARELQPEDLVLFELPGEKLRPYLDCANARGAATVYEHIDNWDTSLGANFFHRETFASFVRDVGHVTVTARMLGEKIREAGRSDWHYCPNAVDQTLFDPEKHREPPRDLVRGKRTLLYFGSLWGEWFDWELVCYVAEHCDCAINLIGDPLPLGDRIHGLPGNIHFLGLKKQTELPAYLQHCDMALLPFKTCDIGKYVSPLKVFEYIAMNRPVLATGLEELSGYPNVTASNDPEVWRSAVEEGRPAEDAALFSAQNSWYARCARLLELSAPGKPLPSVSIVIDGNGQRCRETAEAFSGDYRPEILTAADPSRSWEAALEAKGALLLFLKENQRVLGARYLDCAIQVLEHDPQVGAVVPMGEDGKAELLAAPWSAGRTDGDCPEGGLLIRAALYRQVYDPAGVHTQGDLCAALRRRGYTVLRSPCMGLYAESGAGMTKA